MALSKGDMMEMTGNDEHVDSAIPEYLVEQLKTAKFNIDDVLYAIAYSYKDSSLGRPILLPVAFIKLLENTNITIELACGVMNVTLMDFIKSLLRNDERWEIRLK